METKILEFAGGIILLLLGGVAAAFSWRINHVERESQAEIGAIKKQCAVHLADMADQAKALSSIATMCDLTREDVQYIRARIDNL
jgi:hypothetical protein